MSAAAPDDDIDSLAGEYVLGTLDPTERKVVDAHRQRNPQLDRAIQQWENLFAPLAAAITPVEPTRGIYDALLRRIGSEPSAVAGAGDLNVVGGPRGSATSDRQPLPTDDRRRISRLRRSVGLWKTATALVGTIAALLLIGIALSGPAPGGGQTLVALLQQDAGTPAFLVSVDLRSRVVAVHPVKTEPQPEKSYQLWLVSDRFDKVPKSLGLISDGPSVARRGLEQFDRSVVENATYAVSLEPRGGSPKSVPTGPVLWTGHLVQAVP